MILHDGARVGLLNTLGCLQGRRGRWWGETGTKMAGTGGSTATKYK